jgi:acetyl-CoA synthetase
MSYYKIQNSNNTSNITTNLFVNPKIWGKIAEENFTWYQLWDKVVELIWLKQKLVYRSKIEHS